MAATLAGPGTAQATCHDDARLVAALRQGDETAFARLVEQYHGPLLRLARLYVADSAAAEDVVQETWLGLLRGLDRFEGRASLKTWLFHILVNRARTRAVRDGRTIPFSTLVDLETETVESAADLPEERLLVGELVERVRAAVAALPPAQREVVTLRDVEGWTADEVCRLLDLSDANQRVLLHRGRSKVRAALEAYRASERGLA